MKPLQNQPMKQPDVAMMVKTLKRHATIVRIQATYQEIALRRVDEKEATLGQIMEVGLMMEE